MYNMDHLYRNVEAYYKPAMSVEERDLLRQMKQRIELVAQGTAPDYYRIAEIRA
jgi:hypothetical protein